MYNGYKKNTHPCKKCVKKKEINDKTMSAPFAYKHVLEKKRKTTQVA